MSYELFLTLPQKLSLNQYHTLHYYKLNNVKREFYKEVQFAERRGMLEQPPYHVHYHFYLWGAQMDVSNLMGMIKPIEDGMVKCGLLEDDNHTIIKKITITQERAPSKKKVSYCKVTLEHYGEQTTETHS